MIDVPIGRAMIIWTPRSLNVCVVEWGSEDPRIRDRSRFGRSDCAAWQDYRDGSTSYQLARLWRSALTIIMRDGVPPSAVHNALLVVKEYRETSPGDLQALMPQPIEWAVAP
jgi:hypothetical protein